MYCSDITKENNKKINAKNSDIMFDKAKSYKANILSEEMAHLAMLWLKYYRSDNTTYTNLVNSVIDGMCFSKKEWSKIIDNSKNILKEKYSITVISSEPLILGSDIPFEEIDECISN